MSISKSNLTVFPSLAIVVIRGYEPESPEEADPPGSPNHFCMLCRDNYGHEANRPGILWSDYDYVEPWDFAILIPEGEIEEVRSIIRNAGYRVVRARTVTEPTTFGDGVGTVIILRHPDGWVLASQHTSGEGLFPTLETDQ